MTQEDNELLLKDLSGRILYGLRLKIGDYSDYTLIGVVISDEHPIKVEVTEKDTVYKIEVSVDIIRPYLRPMSSMTEEEIKEYKHLINRYASSNPDSAINMINWLTAHHFDYNGLIEKGLAIEVTKENNPYKE